MSHFSNYIFFGELKQFHNCRENTLERVNALWNGHLEFWTLGIGTFWTHGTGTLGIWAFGIFRHLELKKFGYLELGHLELGHLEFCSLGIRSLGT